MCHRCYLAPFHLIRHFIFCSLLFLLILSMPRYPHQGHQLYWRPRHCSCPPLIRVSGWTAQATPSSSPTGSATGTLYCTGLLLGRYRCRRPSSPLCRTGDRPRSRRLGLGLPSSPKRAAETPGWPTTFRGRRRPYWPPHWTRQCLKRPRPPEMPICFACSA